MYIYIYIWSSGACVHVHRYALVMHALAHVWVCVSKGRRPCCMYVHAYIYACDACACMCVYVCIYVTMHLHWNISRIYRYQVAQKLNSPGTSQASNTQPLMRSMQYTVTHMAPRRCRMTVKGGMLFGLLACRGFADAYGSSRRASGLLMCLELPLLQPCTVANVVKA